MSASRGPRPVSPSTLSRYKQSIRVAHKFFAMFCEREGIDPMRATLDDIQRYIAEKNAHRRGER